MRIDSVFVLFFLALVTLAGTHQLAIMWYLYWIYPWFDIPMHFLGGLFLGLCMVYFFPPKELNISSFFKVILGVLLFSIAWEVFEFFVDENETRRC